MRTIEDVFITVCEYFGEDPEQVIFGKGHKNAHIRFYAMYYAYQLGAGNTHTLANFFELNHTAISHGMKKVVQMRSLYKETKRELQAIDRIFNKPTQIGTFKKAIERLNDEQLEKASEFIDGLLAKNTHL